MTPFIELLFAKLVYVQWAFWILVIEKEISLARFKHLFYYGAVLGSGLLVLFDFKIGIYTPIIFASYIGLWGLTYIFMRGFFSFNVAFPLSMLTVFANSFWWEMPYHALDLAQNGFTVRLAVQLIHVIPLLYLFWRFDVKFDKTLLKNFLKVFGVNAVLLSLKSLIIYQFFIGASWLPSFNHIVLIFSRFYALLVLLKIIVDTWMHGGSERKNLVKLYHWELKDKDSPLWDESDVFTA